MRISLILHFPKGFKTITDGIMGWIRHTRKELYPWHSPIPRYSVY